jgi:hypothetical protein
MTLVVVEQDLVLHMDLHKDQRRRRRKRSGRRRRLTASMV